MIGEVDYFRNSRVAIYPVIYVDLEKAFASRGSLSPRSPLEDPVFLIPVTPASGFGRRVLLGSSAFFAHWNLWSQASTFCGPLD